MSDGGSPAIETLKSLSFAVQDLARLRTKGKEKSKYLSEIRSRKAGSTLSTLPIIKQMQNDHMPTRSAPTRPGADWSGIKLFFLEATELDHSLIQLR